MWRFGRGGGLTASSRPSKFGGRATSPYRISVLGIMILPFAKLGTLVLRTLSKPLASRLKTQASRHPRFRQWIINFAQVSVQENLCLDSNGNPNEFDFWDVNVGFRNESRFFSLGFRRFRISGDNVGRLIDRVLKSDWGVYWEFCAALNSA